MSTPTILIITSGPPSRNPRPLKEALTLSAAGFAVTLLSVFETDFASRCDAELLAGSTVRHIVLRPSESRVRRFLRRARTWTAYRAVRYAGLQPAMVLGPVASLLQHANQLPADLTIVHNEGPFWAGWELLKNGHKVAADFEDWYSEDLLPAARRYRPIRLLRRLEGALLSRAIYTTTTSNALADALVRAYAGNRPDVVTNSFPLQTLTTPSEVPATPAFVWFSQTIGPGRGLEGFISAWSQMHTPSRLVLFGACDRSYRNELEQRAGEARRRLEFGGYITPRELPARISTHHFGLSLEQAAPPSRDLTITNKVLQYLNAGLAIVATDTAGQREVLTRAPDAGEILSGSSTPEWTRQLDALAGAPERISRMRRAARNAAESAYCWEIEAPRVVQRVQRALEQR